MSAGPFATNFAPDWFTMTITVEPFTGAYDGYGNPIHGGPIQMMCFIEDKVRIVRDVTGQERVSNSTLYVAGGPIDTRDRITLPASYKGPLSPPIISCSNVNDRTGFDHAEVFL